LLRWVQVLLICVTLTLKFFFIPLFQLGLKSANFSQ
jgi:hypothetical protein